MRILSTDEEMNVVVGGKVSIGSFLKANAEGALSGVIAGISTGGDSQTKWGAIAGILNNKFAGGAGYFIYH